MEELLLERPDGRALILYSRIVIHTEAQKGLTVDGIMCLGTPVAAAKPTFLARRG
jgi:hypothetical protein